MPITGLSGASSDSILEGYAIDLIYTAMVSGVAPSVYAFLNIIESCYNVFKAVVSYEGILLLTANSVYPIAFFIGVVLALGVFISFAINVVCYFFYSKISAKKILRNGRFVVFY